MEAKGGGNVFGRAIPVEHTLINLRATQNSSRVKYLLLFYIIYIGCNFFISQIKNKSLRYFTLLLQYQKTTKFVQESHLVNHFGKRVHEYRFL